MERERREREAHEQSERTRLKRAAAKHSHGALERGAGRWLADDLLSHRRYRARHGLSLAPCRLSGLHASAAARK